MILYIYTYSNEAELDLDAERPAKRARGDEDSTDFTMASLAKGDITQVSLPSLCDSMTVFCRSVLWTQLVIIERYWAVKL